jgi:hypothetical protein
LIRQIHTAHGVADRLTRDIRTRRRRAAGSGTKGPLCCNCGRAQADERTNHASYRHAVPLLAESIEAPLRPNRIEYNRRRPTGECAAGGG